MPYRLLALDLDGTLLPAAHRVDEPDSAALSGLQARGGPVPAARAVLLGRRERLSSVSFAILACPGKHALMVRTAGPTKGTALAELCRHVGCSLAEAVAVGDWINDVPMFEVAGRSFAMAGA